MDKRQDVVSSAQPQGGDDPLVEVIVLVQELDPIERDILVKAAILAPSMHNTQPWKFHFRHRTVEVYCDPTRALGAEDPEGRMTVIGVGAAVFNLRVAAACLGHSASVVPLPDTHRPTLVAEVIVGSQPVDVSGPAALYPYLAHRRTNRHPFADRALPTEVRDQLAQAAHEEGAMLEWIDQPDRVRWLLELATEAAIAEADDPRRLVERQRWVGGERTRDGVPSSAFGPRSYEPSGPVRDLAIDPADRLRSPGRFEPRPNLAVLWTVSDQPRDWLAAGQALERVLLVATTQGVAASLLNQPLEHTDLRWLVRDPRAGWSMAQAVLRFGYGPEVLPTPRRPAEEFVLADDDALPAEGR
ncbi:Acg family FMN-binding oxidoreductase [Actinopolymorpha alba]|uniref:Acg family FMN-binding oxidoreductase n=1 Tax=Actinopolymorpha alba TaxID=533267 RepID=UPI00035DFDEB|nr:hypothetical protein [Actinopolymorpha alba]